MSSESYCCYRHVIFTSELIWASRITYQLPAKRTDDTWSFLVRKSHKEFAGLAVNGKKAFLQPPGSDVIIYIPDGVHGVIMTHAHTNFRPFQDAVPESECFVAPVVEVHCSDSRTSTTHGQKECEPFVETRWFEIQVPHCVRIEDIDGVKVWHGDIHRF